MRPRSSMPTYETVAPDALLVHRVAALSDKTALAELDARYGLTLYALAYSFLFDGEAADVAVAPCCARCGAARRRSTPRAAAWAAGSPPSPVASRATACAARHGPRSAQP